ncbi:MAG TPA: hypothetical protein VM123_13695 [archaeon]|nr:hypothetical protein [archaeon]
MKTGKIFVLLQAALILGLFCYPAASEVILSEDFESGSLGDKWEKYNEDPARGGFETRPDYVHSGKKSYRLTTLAYKGEGEIIRGHAYKQSDSWIRTWFLPGYDQTYIRFYVKFAEDFDPGKGMHWCQFWGCRPDNPRSVLGKAGQMPDGTDRFITSLDPVRKEGDGPPPGQVAFYTYWPDMKQSPDGRYWGNFFYPERSFFFERGKWYCIEVMVKVNDIGKKNGEQALWIDGGKIMHFNGFRWRDVENLKLNMVMLGLYVGYCEKDCTYWVDDFVISTNYAGPMQGSIE